MRILSQLFSRVSTTGPEGERLAIGQWRDIISWVVVAVLLIILAVGGGPFDQALVGLGGAYVIASLGYNLVLGYAGQFAFCQAACMACGAYGLALTQAFGKPTALGVVIGIAAASLFGLVMGVVVLRTRGFYLALVTLGAGQALILGLGLWNKTGGTDGIPATFLTPRAVTIIVVIVLAVCGLAAIRLVRSRFGRAFLMIRHDETAAAAMGVSPRLVRVGSFTLSGFLGGIGGVLFAASTGFISTDSFTIDLTLLLLTVIVVGGLANVWGTLVGGIVVVYFSQSLTFTAGTFGIVYGVALLVVLALFPQGIAGGIRLLAGRLIARWSPALVSEEGPATAPPEPPAATRVGPPPVPAQATSDGPGPASLISDAPAGGTLLSIDGLSVTFGGVDALRDVSVSFAPNEIVSIVGPNGAGKTTLLNAISGMVHIRTGRLLYSGAGDEKDLRALPASARSRLGIARTFQQSALFGDMCVLDQVLCGAQSTESYHLWQALGRSSRYVGAERRVLAKSEEMIERLGLTRFLGTPANQLPGPSRRMVDLARALISRPRLLLLDEIAAGLTPPEKANLASLILDEVRDSGATVVLIEHDLTFVRQLAPRTVVLANGALLAAGPTDVVLERADVIEAYIGAPPPDLAGQDDTNRSLL
jgi:branched-chain amino acid transport system permease protein